MTRGADQIRTKRAGAAGGRSSGHGPAGCVTTGDVTTGDVTAWDVTTVDVTTEGALTRGAGRHRLVGVVGVLVLHLRGGGDRADE